MGLARIWPSEADLSFRDTSLWFPERHPERDQIPPGPLFSLGRLPETLLETLVLRFPAIVVGEEC